MSHPEMPEVPGSPLYVEPVERALLSMVYGVHVIGSHAADGTLNAMIADWVMQVSFKPRLVAVSVENSARTLRFIRETGVFSVNLLHEKDGESIARKVVMPAEGSKIKGRSESEAAKIHDKLAGLDYVLSETGCPLLNDGLAWYSCEAQDFVEAGDHTLVIGLVTDGDVVRTGDALTEKELGWEYAG